MKKRHLMLLQLIPISLFILSIFGSILILPFVQNITDSGLQKKIIIPDWTYMVYLDADNNLDSYGIGDINEMEEGYNDAVSSNVNVIVFIDREFSGAKTYKIQHDTSGSIVSPILTTGFLSEPNMGSKTTLKNFIIYVFNNFPAEHYVLDLWDHGSGIFGICWDDSSGNDKLTFDEVDEALVEACSLAGETIDILTMDACLMQMLEVCYEMNDYVDYIVASEETIPGYGYPYDDMIDTLCDTPSQSPATYANAMVTDYHASYSASYDTTLSAVNVTSGSINNLMAAFNLFTAELNTQVATQKSAISSARAATQEFYYDIFVDLYDFAYELESRVTGTDFKDTCDWLMGNISDAVLNSLEWNNPDAYGIAIYFPDNSGDYNSGYGTSIDLGEDTDWDLFLTTFYFGPTYHLDLDGYLLDDGITVDPANDGDGIVDQGETINITITIRNTGSILATSVNGTLSCSDGNITILVGFQVYGTIAGGATDSMTFLFNVSLSAPNGLIVTFKFDINATYITLFHKTETLIVIINYSTIIGGDSFENAVLINEGIFESLMPGPDPTDGSAWFKISCPADKYLIVSIIAAAPGTDFDVYIYNELGQLQSAAIGESYPDSCSIFVLSTGFYIIRVYSYAGSGSFTLNVTLFDVTGPEDGLSIGTAFTLIVDGPTLTSTLPSGAQDYLFYRVFLQEGESVTAWLRGQSSQHDFDLYLYDRLLNELDYSWKTQYPEQIDWTATYSGVYYLIVKIWSGSGDFEIEVESQGGAAIGNFWVTLITLIVAFVMITGFYRFFKKTY
ncbi:MAG: hypothetical protein HWN66_12465 [Candidatus Helarchaeota archaeon]|nr:hypothetical protein [Candidatus Helarchaeota archaeon]